MTYDAIIMTREISNANRVRARRQALGMTQADLARSAGISRTAVTAIEGGRLAPSVNAAIALSRALNVTVESLFADESHEAPAEWAWLPASRPWRGWLAEVGGRRLLFPVEAADRSMSRHDACLADDMSRLAGSVVAAKTLVVATCDPAANLMASLYQEQTGFRMIVISRSSQKALDLLATGLVHVAGLHLGGKSHGTSNADAVQRSIPGDCLLVRAANWSEGVAVGQGVSTSSISRLKGSRVRWVGREPGSGARQCLDQVLGGTRKYERMAADHRGVVELIRLGIADAGICVELSSAESGLRFLSIRRERYDLCIPQSLADDPRVRGLITLLRSSDYRAMLEDLPGYTADDVGEIRLLPGAGSRGSRQPRLITSFPRS
jgi:putative molybdopterin biosynthesis protein